MPIKLIPPNGSAVVQTIFEISPPASQAANHENYASIASQLESMKVTYESSPFLVGDILYTPHPSKHQLAKDDWFVPNMVIFYFHASKEAGNCLKSIRMSLLQNLHGCCVHVPIYFRRKNGLLSINIPLQNLSFTAWFSMATVERVFRGIQGFTAQLLQTSAMKEGNS